MGDLSIDPTAAMKMYMAMSQNYKTMNDHVDILELGYDIVSKRQILGKKSKLRSMVTDREIVDVGGRTADLLRDAIDSLVYGQTKKEEIGTLFGKEVNWGKLADVFNKYVSLNGLGLNLAAALTNPLITRILQVQEAVAKEFVTGKSLIKADKLYALHLPSYMKDIGKLTSDSKLHHFGILMDSMQDWNKEVYGDKANRNRITRATTGGNGAYFMMSAGEHHVTNRMALAMVEEMNLTIDGEKISPLDIFEIKDNVAELKENIKKEDGSDFTQEDLVDLRLRIASANQRLVGVYNDLDRAAAKRYAAGRMAMVFRSWMPASVNRRFSKRYFDYRTNALTEGTYTSFFTWLGTSVRDSVVNKELRFVKNWKEMTPEQRANSRRTTVEIAQMIFLTVAIGILTGLSDDDEDNYLLAIAAVQANRAYTELAFYHNPVEFLNIMRSPFAGIRTLTTISKLFDSVNAIDYFTGKEEDFLRRYKGGRHAGEVYLTRQMLNLIPPVEQVSRAIYPYELLEFYNN
jgi:hypothetical protein